MPPKTTKTAKAKALELKQKNTDEAKKIISMMMLSTTATMDTNSSSILNSEGVNNLSKKSTNETGNKSGLKPSSGRTNKTPNVATSKLSKNISASSSETRAKDSNEKNAPKSRMSSSANQIVSKVGNAAVAYHYEIDCNRVSDSIDVVDLQKYLEKQLKVNGEKSNFGDNATIRCEDQKVVINSKVFIPKRALRFLSKKFLKKSWNIQVKSKNKNSYEFNYVGNL